MYLGSYTIYFSGKNRLILPKKIRKELGDDEKFFIILGKDGEIWGFDRENWQTQAEEVLKESLGSLKGRVARRKFFSQADECLLDRQGRFVLPQEFVDRSGLKTEVLIIGAGDHFEIWDKRIWEEELKRMEREER